MAPEGGFWPSSRDMRLHTMYVIRDSPRGLGSLSAFQRPSFTRPSWLQLALLAGAAVLLLVGLAVIPGGEPDVQEVSAKLRKRAEGQRRRLEDTMQQLQTLPEE